MVAAVVPPQRVINVNSFSSIAKQLRKKGKVEDRLGIKGFQFTATCATTAATTTNKQTNKLCNVLLYVLYI